VPIPGRVSWRAGVPTAMLCETEWGTYIMRSMTERGGVRTTVQSETKEWSTHQGDGKGDVVGWGGKESRETGCAGIWEILPWRSSRRLFVRWRGGVMRPLLRGCRNLTLNPLDAGHAVYGEAT
jgi:hypothetical protein